MTSTLDDNADLTCDAFLGGQLQIWQPRSGYRAGVDPVFLAASVAAQPGQSVLELGCGVGVAILCLARRVGDIDCFGLELQPAYADLARRNATENSLKLSVETGDIARPPHVLRARQFDHVICNPPYYSPSRGTHSNDIGRNLALRETAPLGSWIDAACRRLAPRGRLSMIMKADRLPDLLTVLDARLGDVHILPLCPRTGRSAELILLQARKGAKGPFRLLSNKVIHMGAKHLRDQDSYTPEISRVLRDGDQLKVE